MVRNFVENRFYVCPFPIIQRLTKYFFFRTLVRVEIRCEATGEECTEMRQAGESRKGQIDCCNQGGQGDYGIE